MLALNPGQDCIRGPETHRTFESLAHAVRNSEIYLNRDRFLADSERAGLCGEVGKRTGHHGKSSL
jgi:hypothetical protein